MALADLHYGYEIHRCRQGALLPGWGMEQCRNTLLALLSDHRPQRLILVGDIMDGSGSVAQTGTLLDELRSLVPTLVLIEGNHDRSALVRGWQMQKHHRENQFIFHHGHLGITPPSVVADSSTTVGPVTLVTGHEHPSVAIRDNAGLRLKLPAFIQQQVHHTLHHWILPAFSPWAAGGEYTSLHEPLATWVCSPGRIWKWR